MESYRILIIEDDKSISSGISQALSGWGFDVREAENFADILSEVTEYKPHLILLDIGLPFYNGFYWCKKIRETMTVPIMFISSINDNMNMVMAMNMGGDDFISKPFDINYLIAKIQALLRRSYDFTGSNEIIQAKGAFLQVNDNTLIYNDQKLDLSKNEYRILWCLMSNKGKVVSREALMEALWQTDCFIDDNTLTVNINRLRKKLEEIGLIDFISTKHGRGYIVE